MYVHKLDSPLPPIKYGATDKKQRQEQFRGKHPFKIKKKQKYFPLVIPYLFGWLN